MPARSGSATPSACSCRPAGTGGREDELLDGHGSALAAAVLARSEAGEVPVALDSSDGIGSNAGGCGACGMNPATAGSIAHRIIGAAFESFYPGIVYKEQPFGPLIPNRPGGRLDLMMPTASGVAIGEIKPANVDGVLEANDDLQWYEDQITNLFNMPVTRLRVPPPVVSLEFITPKAPGCPQALRVIRAERPSGAYLYWCEPDGARLDDKTCGCRSRQRVPEPAPEPDRAPKQNPDWVVTQVGAFLDEVAEGGRDVEIVVQEFLVAHAALARHLSDHPWAAATGVIVMMLLLDVLSGGVAVTTNPEIIAALGALVSAAKAISH